MLYENQVCVNQPIIVDIADQTWQLRLSAGPLFDSRGKDANKDIDYERKIITIGGTDLTALEVVALVADALSDAKLYILLGLSRAVPASANSAMAEAMRPKRFEDDVYLNGERNYWAGRDADL